MWNYSPPLEDEMPSFRIVSICAILAAFGISIAPADAQGKNHGIDQEKFDSIMKLVEDAAKSKSYRRDTLYGDGQTPYEDTSSKPGILTGLELWSGARDRGVLYVRGVRPIYLNNKGSVTEGKIHGNVGTRAESVRLEAKSGYAVGGLKIHTNGGELAGLSVVFYKVDATGLDTTDSYESKYFGNGDPNTTKLIGGTSDPILGVYGSVAADIRSNNFGLGLIIMGEKKKK
jgi:hypothetical protein